jgi:LysR family hydrogen peroxide-inducible transcriptional activator
MEIRQMRYVMQVAEEKHFSRAAEKLHIAQPSLSQQISKLEKELGVQLFDRTTSPLELTYAGKRYVESARSIIDRVEQLKKEMQDISEVKKGTLLIGSMPMTGAHVLPRLIPTFQKKFPGIAISLLEETSYNLEALTLKGLTDVSLLSLPLDEHEYEWIPLLDEEIGIALPPGHPKSPEKALKLCELRDEPFILLKKGQGLHTMALKLCNEAGFHPRIVFESSNIETVQSLVAAGLGVAFVPRLVARVGRSEDSPRYVSLDPIVVRTLVLAYKKGRYLSKASKAFIDSAKNVHL